MTIKELKQKIENIPDTMDVFIVKHSSEFDYDIVNRAEIKELGFSEDPYGPILSTVEVFILSDH